LEPRFTDWFRVLDAPINRFDLKTDRFEIKIARFDLKIVRFEAEILRFDVKNHRFEMKIVRFAVKPDPSFSGIPKHLFKPHLLFGSLYDPGRDLACLPLDTNVGRFIQLCGAHIDNDQLCP